MSRAGATNLFQAGLAAAALAFALALAGCGGGASPRGGASPPADLGAAATEGTQPASWRDPAVARDGQAAARRGAPPAAYGSKSPDAISAATGTPSVARFPTGRDSDEVSETGAKPPDPCHLVPLDTAAAILDGPVHARREPLGPTCVFTIAGSERQVTLAIEHSRLASLRLRARRATRIAVSGRAGWCLRYEATAVVVPLSDSRLLHVTGPCRVAALLAAHALPRAAG